MSSTVVKRAPDDMVPEQIREELCRFLLDKSTGNFILNVVDGRIMSFSSERFVRLTT